MEDINSIIYQKYFICNNVLILSVLSGVSEAVNTRSFKGVQHHFFDTAGQKICREEPH